MREKRKESGGVGVRNEKGKECFRFDNQLFVVCYKSNSKSAKQVSLKCM